MLGLGKKRQGAPMELPESMKQQDPVNYNSVLDYLVGLSNDDFKKMTKSAEIYRKANRDVANLLEVEDEPTTALKTEQTITDDELDAMLAANVDDLRDALIEDEIPVKHKKAQATEKKVEV